MKEREIYVHPNFKDVAIRILNVFDGNIYGIAWVNVNTPNQNPFIIDTEIRFLPDKFRRGLLPFPSIQAAKAYLKEMNRRRTMKELQRDLESLGKVK